MLTSQKKSLKREPREATQRQDRQQFYDTRSGWVLFGGFASILIILIAVEAIRSMG